MKHHASRIKHPASSIIHASSQESWFLEPCLNFFFLMNPMFIVCSLTCSHPMSRCVPAVGLYPHHSKQEDSKIAKPSFHIPPCARFIRVVSFRFLFLFLFLFLRRFFMTWLITVGNRDDHKPPVRHHQPGARGLCYPWAMAFRKNCRCSRSRHCYYSINVTSRSNTTNLYRISACINGGNPGISLFEPNRGEGCASDGSVLVTIHNPLLSCCQLHTASFAIKPRRRQSLRNLSNRWATDG